MGRVEGFQVSSARSFGKLRTGSGAPGTWRLAGLLLVQVIVHVDDVSLEVLFEAVLAVCAADAGFAPSGMEALHGFEVFAIDVGFAEFELVGGAHGGGKGTGVDGGGEEIGRASCRG